MARSEYVLKGIKRRGRKGTEREGAVTYNPAPSPTNEEGVGGGSVLCMGHSGNPRDSLSVLRSKGCWKGQSDFSAVCGNPWDFLTIELCVGNSGNPS